MENLEDLLKNKKPQLPPQVDALKRYAQEHYDTTITVRSSPKHYQVRVPNGALAHRMRVDTADIMTVCNLDKPLVIQISYGD